MRLFNLLALAAVITFATSSQAEPAGGDGPYKLVKSAKVGGAGGFDYVVADGEGRKLYVPRGNRVMVYDLDSLAPAGEIPETKGVHGVAVDPKSGHGFASSKPVVMFDTKTLATIKTIDVEGNPDGILFDPATDHVLVLSHRTPNVTVISASDGSIAGTIDLGGAPEQAASDGQGRIYIDLEDKDKIAVVDSKAMKLITTYDLAGKGGGPAGLALDAKNHVLFAFCRKPQTAVILNADDGKILATLPIGAGSDGGLFNPATMEAFSSQRDGTLTVIKETSPTAFEVEQTVQTKAGAKTCSLDAKTSQVFLITAEFGPAPTTAPAANGRRSRGQMVPDSFTILVVGK
jgi:DNA-binding beta-propeller fold protein YncE